MLFRVLNVFLFCCVSFVAAVGQQGLTPAKVLTSTGNHHTKVSLISNVQAIVPGEKFLVGVMMKMEEGWHTYWKNPGESGLPTQIRWTLPAGFTVGEIQWPLPHKYNETGDVLTYGYETENMLLVPITAPDALEAGTRVKLVADVSWLECERLCIPGSASVGLNLPVSSGEASSDNGEVFRKYLGLVPGQLVLERSVSLAPETRNGAVELVLSSSAGPLVFRKDEIPDFYPESMEELLIGRTEVTVRENRAVLRVPLSAYEPVQGSRTLKGVLLYQLESGERRFGTVEVPLTPSFNASLPIAGEETARRSLLDLSFVMDEAGGEPLPMYMYILFALAGGLLLNVMPCVLPVIALKVFGLVNMSGDRPAQVKKHGWSFSAGILGSFMVLAMLVVLLQAAGEQVGWGFQFQEPLFIIIMSTIVFAFGLSLFGVYELGLFFVLAFASVGSALEKQSKEGKGYSASFSEGVFATILATPCTAPFLGTALGFAFSQPAWTTILIFASAGMGMALPYLILTMKPSWMKFLPKPGEWMVTVKQLMGFLMMATLIWLLYILGKQLGMEAIVWTCAFLLVVGLACWIIGKFATLNVSRPRYIATIASALALVAGGYMFFVETILDVRTVIAGVSTTPSAIVTTDRDGIQWRPFSLEQLEQYLNENQTVFIDFTADWCLTCKVNEKTVLTDRQVVEKFREHDLVAIKADWTNRNPDITRLLAKFGRSGVPLYVVFPAGRPTEPIVLPEVITTGIVLDAISRATSPAAAEILP